MLPGPQYPAPPVPSTTTQYDLGAICQVTGAICLLTGNSGKNYTWRKFILSAGECFHGIVQQRKRYAYRGLIIPMEENFLAVIVLIALLFSALLLPIFVKRRGRSWFLGGKIIKTFRGQFASLKRFHVKELAVHVIETRRNHLIGMEFTQKTSLGQLPVHMVFSAEDAQSFATMLQDAIEHSKHK